MSLSDTVVSHKTQFILGDVPLPFPIEVDLDDISINSE